MHVLPFWNIHSKKWASNQQITKQQIQTMISTVETMKHVTFSSDLKVTKGSQHGVRVESMASGAQLPGFKSWLYHLPAV